MFVDNQVQEAILYFSYMMVDGGITDSEEKIFNALCEELEIADKTKEEIIRNCIIIFGDSDDILGMIINYKIGEQAGQTPWGLKSGSDLTRIIWNLVNLGYADLSYSNEEKQIVDYLVDLWSVNALIYQEIMDTMDTILALTKQKEWIGTTFDRSFKRDKKEREIDDAIEMLMEDMKLSIAEIEMKEVE